MKYPDVRSLMKRASLLLVTIFFFLGASACYAARYEYKLLPLGSLTSLQKDGKSAARTKEIEALLNGEGKDGWEVVNIFAVRTTFDPNVFFVVLKRELD